MRDRVGEDMHPVKVGYSVKSAYFRNSVMGRSPLDLVENT